MSRDEISQPGRVTRDPFAELMIQQFRILATSHRRVGNKDLADRLDERYGAAASMYRRDTGYDLITNFNPDADPSFGLMLEGLANLDTSAEQVEAPSSTSE